MQEEEVTNPRMPSREQSAQRYIWLLTYGAGGPNIDANMFAEYGRLAVDESYTTIDRALKYTLIHLKTKNRDTALRKFMTYCYQRYGIVEQEIFGYSSVSSNSMSSELFVHPAFCVLVQHQAELRPCFSWWIETPGLRGGGILASYSRHVSLPVPVTAVTDEEDKELTSEQSLLQESRNELEKVNEEALATEQRLLWEFRNELEKSKQDAEEYKTSLQESKNELEKVKQDAEEYKASLQESKNELEKVKKDAEKCKANSLESEAELKKVKQEALVSEISNRNSAHELEARIVTVTAELAGERSVREALQEGFSGGSDAVIAQNLSLKKAVAKLEVNVNYFRGRGNKDGPELIRRQEVINAQDAKLKVFQREADDFEEKKKWHEQLQKNLLSEHARMQRVIARNESVNKDEELEALRAEIARVNAESEENVSGLLSIRKRDGMIEEMRVEIEKLHQGLKTANSERDKADNIRSIMEDVVVEVGGVARELVRKRVMEAYYNAGDLWDGDSSYLGGEGEGGGKRKKKRADAKKILWG